MKTINIAAGAIALSAALLLLSSCQGRTSKNVESNGETIEVKEVNLEEKADPEIAGTEENAPELTEEGEIVAGEDTLAGMSDPAV